MDYPITILKIGSAILFYLSTGNTLCKSTFRKLRYYTMAKVSTMLYFACNGKHLMFKIKNVAIFLTLLWMIFRSMAKETYPCRKRVTTLIAGINQPPGCNAKEIGKCQAPSKPK